MEWFRNFVLLLASACAGALAVASETPISAEQQEKLASWYEALGAPGSAETFGRYLARSAQIQHGVPYEELLPLPGRETLRVNLDAFECVSFIESTIAVARCGWRGQATSACFVQELEASRYRNGEMGDYASRLHYFVEWISDNETRGRVENLTASLGGEPVRKDFFYITRRQLPHAQLAGTELAAITAGIRATEERLSTESHPILTRDSAPPVLGNLQDGDLVAFVRERPGLLVHHAGFVFWATGTPRLLHASSYHQRVVITIQDLSDYLLRRPERQGVIVARPLKPER